MIASDIEYAGFACPQVGLDRDFLDYLLVEHARQTVETFVERYATDLEKDANGLVPMLVNWLSRPERFETVWDLSFGEMYGVLFSDDLEYRRTAGAVGLRMNEFGLEGEWELSLPNPTRFCFDRWLLPLGDAIRVSAHSDSVSIATRQADVWRQTKFHRSAEGWSTYDADSVPTVNYGGIRLLISTGQSLAPTTKRMFLSAEAYKVSHEGVDSDTNLMVNTGKAALGLIDQYADIYLPWVSQVTTNLVPLPARLGTTNSASGNLAPGAIAVSNQESVCVLAEMLVHEATHQYLYILKRLGPIDDGTDETLYYSPFREMGRPILYIVFAYHSFGNVLLFYRKTKQNGLPADDHVNEQLQKLEGQLATLETALQTTTALTPVGRALWEPLYEQIHN